MSAVVTTVPRRGWRVVARKEFADHVHSVRFIILAVLLGLAAAGAVSSAVGGIKDAASQASGSPALFLRLFTITSEQSRLPSFVQLIGLIGPLLGIAFGFDAVNGERSQGTLPRLLSQPIYRDDVINGKFAAGFAAIGLVLSSLVAIVAGFGMVRLGIVPTLADATRLVVFVVVAMIYIGLWLAFATLTSVWLRRAATSALASIAAWLVVTLFAFLLIGIFADLISPVPPDATPTEQLANAQMQQTLGRLSPGTLFEEATGALLNPQVRSTGLIFVTQLDRAIPNPLTLDQSLLIVWPQVTGLIALLVISFAAAYILFMRQEIRA